MAKRLSLVAFVLAAFGIPGTAQAQTPPLQVGIQASAPASLVCDQTGTATVTVRAPVAPFELMLVIDESGSIAAPDFLRLKSFMIDFVRSFQMGPDHTRIGVVMFSSTARSITGLSGSQPAVVNEIGR